MNKKDYINGAIDHALHEETKLNPKALAMDGMSSPKVRKFLNKLLETPESRYLEIGVWRGFCTIWK
jgi:predicted O-methyltransferase YrrM